MYNHHPHSVRLILSLALSLSIVSGLFSQYTISYRYAKNTYDQWNTVTTDNAFPQNHELALGYYFKLPKFRVEFLPELVYGTKSSASLRVRGHEGSNVSQSYAALSIPIHFYLFNMKDDCDCPTFSKQGPKFLHSLSVFAAPRVRYTIRSFEHMQEDANIIPSLGLGVAYDIGISDLITFTPHLGIHLNFNDEWKSTVTKDVLFPKDSFTTLMAGIRTILRFDYVRKNKW